MSMLAEDNIIILLTCTFGAFSAVILLAVTFFFCKNKCSESKANLHGIESSPLGRKILSQTHALYREQEPKIHLSLAYDSSRFVNDEPDKASMQNMQFSNILLEAKSNCRSTPGNMNDYRPKSSFPAVHNYPWKSFLDLPHGIFASYEVPQKVDSQGYPACSSQNRNYRVFSVNSPEFQESNGASHPVSLSDIGYGSRQSVSFDQAYPRRPVTECGYPPTRKNDISQPFLGSKFTYRSQADKEKSHKTEAVDLERKYIGKYRNKHDLNNNFQDNFSFKKETNTEKVSYKARPIPGKIYRPQSKDLDISKSTNSVERSDSDKKNLHVYSSRLRSKSFSELHAARNIHISSLYSVPKKLKTGKKETNDRSEEISKKNEGSTAQTVSSCEDFTNQRLGSLQMLDNYLKSRKRVSKCEDIKRNEINQQHEETLSIVTEERAVDSDICKNFDTYRENSKSDRSTDDGYDSVVLHKKNQKNNVSILTNKLQNTGKLSPKNSTRSSRTREASALTTEVFSFLDQMDSASIADRDLYLQPIHESKMQI